MPTLTYHMSHTKSFCDGLLLTNLGRYTHQILLRRKSAFDNLGQLTPQLLVPVFVNATHPRQQVITTIHELLERQVYVDTCTPPELYLQVGPNRP
jgi:hypothetical protein